MTENTLESSKQRVLAAVHLTQPDRVPMDFQANPCVRKRLHRDLNTSMHRQLLRQLGSDIVDLPGVGPRWPVCQYPRIESKRGIAGYATRSPWNAFR